MRLTRFVSALVGLVLAVAGPLAVMHPADAAGKPKHDIQITGAANVGHTNKFFVAGKVSTYPSHKIKLLKAKGSGRRSLAKKGKTDAKGKFRITFRGPIGECYWIDVPSTSVYRETVKKIGCIKRA